ncbi:large ribosomal subunit protein mL54 [Cololabis saira]|uniref:large ribosomal subunit protein mL54 n=1 Tax=Cololabis saira TaxID=129043 RepID=UPI002AD25691|nr:large ribosomal subunit protein mL54 [Cololabis saira]
MSGCGLLRIALSTKCMQSSVTTLLNPTNMINRMQTCGYAKKVVAKGKGKGMVKDELSGPDVCKDPARLVSYAVGANILKQGEDPKLKPDEEYPEWLFQLNLGKAKTVHELEPDTWEYWKRLRKENIWRNNRLLKGKKL